MIRATDVLFELYRLPPSEQAWALRLVRATLSVVLAIMHALFGVVCLFRPDLFRIYPVWSGFDQVAPTAAWGLITIGTGVAMLLCRGLLVMVAQGVSVIVMTTITILISAATGPNTGTGTYSALACLSGLAFVLTLGPWLDQQAWYARLGRRVRRGPHGD